MSNHDWRKWETCECGENGCRSSWVNTLLRPIVADHGTEQEKPR